MHYINKLLIVRLISYTTGRESRIMCDSGQKLKHFHEKKKNNCKQFHCCLLSILAYVEHHHSVHVLFSIRSSVFQFEVLKS